MAEKKMTKAEKQRRARILERAENVKIIKSCVKDKPKFNILAIDPATMLGWALDYENYGTFDLSDNGKESRGFKWLRFEIWLEDMIKKNDIKAIAYEMSVTQNAGATIHHSKINGILEKVCASRGVPCVEFSPSELKKFATDKGNCGKALVVEFAQKLLNYEGKDDNESDALWLYTMLKKKLFYEKER